VEGKVKRRRRRDPRPSLTQTVPAKTRMPSPMDVSRLVVITSLPRTRQTTLKMISQYQNLLHHWEISLLPCRRKRWFLPLFKASKTSMTGILTTFPILKMKNRPKLPSVTSIRTILSLHPLCKKRQHGRHLDLQANFSTKKTKVQSLLLVKRPTRAAVYSRLTLVKADKKTITSTNSGRYHRQVVKTTHCPNPNPLIIKRMSQTLFHGPRITLSQQPPNLPQ